MEGQPPRHPSGRDAGPGPRSRRRGPERRRRQARRHPRPEETSGRCAWSAIEPFGLPLQVWIGAVIMLVILVLLFL